MPKRSVYLLYSTCYSYRVIAFLIETNNTGQCESMKLSKLTALNATYTTSTATMPGHLKHTAKYANRCIMQCFTLP